MYENPQSFVLDQVILTTSLQRSIFDITLPTPAAFPPAYSIAYFNQRWVQEALGVPVNFTLSANAVVNNFFGSTGDPVIVTKRELESVLDSGVGVAMVYGDLDYRCNCKSLRLSSREQSKFSSDSLPGMGAENVSLSASYSDAAAFQSAGYAPITTNSSYQGGLVRQFKNFSFSRVFQAGHIAGAYQPETVLRIFERAIFGRDVATGEAEAGGSSSYASQGPASVLNVTNEIRDPIVGPICFWYDALETCDEAQQEALEKNVAVIEDYVVVSPAGTLSSTSGNPSSTAAAPQATVSKSAAARRFNIMF